SFDPAKPTMPRIFLLATIWRATVAATCGLSWLSPSTKRFSLTRCRLFGTPGIALPAFQLLMYSFIQLLWSLPRNAAPPVSGPAKPRPALLHSGFFAAVLSDLADAVPPSVAATTTATVAAMAAIAPTFFNIQTLLLGRPHPYDACLRPRFASHRNTWR